MNAVENPAAANARRKKRTVGIVAIVILIALFVLSIPPLRLFNTLVWLILAVAVAVIANLINRRIDKQAAEKSLSPSKTA